MRSGSSRRPPRGAAGQKQILSTTVSRSGGTPVAGWTVRYEIVDGPDAGFTARGDTSIEVKTDAAGRATVELLPRTTQPGITMIKMQIIRPGSARGDLPQMVIGQGQTAVSWNTPGLQVTAVGPSTVPADGAVGYRVEVTNSGDLPTRGVTVSYTPPTGVTLLNSTPAAQVFGQRYEWRIGDLPARTTSLVELNCRAAVAADVRSCFIAKSGDGLTAEGCATTRVFANALSVKLSGPDAVEMGREAKFLVEITNIGTTALSNITASDTFDPGLQHLQGERSPIVQARAVSLAPGQSDRFAVSFIVIQPGRHCHRMDVTADGGQRASARGCVTGTQSATPAPSPAPSPSVLPPQLGLRFNGPASRRAGEVAEYFVELTNTGGSAATNVVIGVQYGVNLQLKEASRGHRDDLRRLTTGWRVVQIAAGETVSRQLNCLCLNPDDRATVRATVASDQTAAKTAEFVTQIAPGAVSPVERPVAPMPPVEQPAAGNLKVTIADIADPIKLGEKTTFLIELTNDRAVSDKDVVITLQFTDGLKVLSATGPAGILSVSPDGTAELAPIKEIRAGEKLPAFKIEATGVKAGRQKGADHREKCPHAGRDLGRDRDHGEYGGKLAIICLLAACSLVAAFHPTPHHGASGPRIGTAFRPRFCRPSVPRSSRNWLIFGAYHVAPHFSGLPLGEPRPDSRARRSHLAGGRTRRGYRPALPRLQRANERRQLCRSRADGPTDDRRRLHDRLGSRQPERPGPGFEWLAEVRRGCPAPGKGPGHSTRTG